MSRCWWLNIHVYVWKMMNNSDDCDVDYGGDDDIDYDNGMMNDYDDEHDNDNDEHDDDDDILNMIKLYY